LRHHLIFKTRRPMARFLSRLKNPKMNGKNSHPRFRCLPCRRQWPIKPPRQT
jgi:transposase-like protein